MWVHWLSVIGGSFGGIADTPRDPKTNSARPENKKRGMPAYVVFRDPPRRATRRA